MGKGSNKKFVQRRIWLRPASSWGPNSSCTTTVNFESYTDAWRKNKKVMTSRGLDGTLTLTDCSNTVGYSFDADNGKQYKRHLAMMNKLVNEITNLRDGWVEAHDELHKRGGWKS